MDIKTNELGRSAQRFLWLSVAVAGFLTWPIIGFFWIHIDSEPNELASNELIWMQRFSFFLCIASFLIAYKLLAHFSYRLVFTPILGTVLANLVCILFIQYETVFLIKPFKLLSFWTILALSLGIGFGVSFSVIFTGKAVCHLFKK